MFYGIGPVSPEAAERMRRDWSEAYGNKPRATLRIKLVPVDAVEDYLKAGWRRGGSYAPGDHVEGVYVSRVTH